MLYGCYTDATYAHVYVYICTYAQDCKIRVWNLNTMQKSHMLIGHEGVVS